MKPLFYGYFSGRTSFHRDPDNPCRRVPAGIRTRDRWTGPPFFPPLAGSIKSNFFIHFPGFIQRMNRFTENFPSGCTSFPVERSARQKTEAILAHFQVRFRDRCDGTAEVTENKGSLLSGCIRLMNRIAGAWAVRSHTPTCDARCRPRKYPRGLHPLTPAQPSGHLVYRVYFRRWPPPYRSSDQHSVYRKQPRFSLPA